MERLPRLNQVNGEVRYLLGTPEELESAVE